MRGKSLSGKIVKNMKSKNLLRISNKVNVFNQAFKNEFEVFTEFGLKIYWSANFSDFKGDKESVPAEMIDISISNSFFSSTNKNALKMIESIIENNKIDIIYCSTPIGGTLGRIASKKHNKVKVIYAAHGFLFFKGNNWFKNLIFLCHEKFLSKYNDCLITITQEDFNAANRYNLCDPKHTYLIHGAGVNTTIAPNSVSSNFRLQNGFLNEDFLIVSAGFLNHNKNNQIVIRALAKLKNASVKYVICGEGKERKKLEKIVTKYHLDEKVFFLGFRTDVIDIMKCCNAFVMPSFREGLPRSLLEAMIVGLPCIGSDIRGIKDLIGDSYPELICNPKNENAFACAIRKIMSMTEDEKNKLAFENRKKAQMYSNEVVKKELRDIFSQEID